MSRNQIPLPDVVQNVYVILIAELVSFARIRNALKNLILATHHLVDQEQFAWSITLEIQSAGNKGSQRRDLKE